MLQKVLIRIQYLQEDDEGGLGAMEEDKILLLLLNEIKEMSRQQREEKRPIEEMSKRISDCENFFNSVVENSHITNQSMIREIRSHILRFNILINPETRNMYRTENDANQIKVSNYRIPHKLSSIYDILREIRDLTLRQR